MLNEPIASRHHLQIVASRDHVVLEDFKSTNGVYLSSAERPSPRRRPNLVGNDGAVDIFGQRSVGLTLGAKCADSDVAIRRTVDQAAKDGVVS